MYKSGYITVANNTKLRDGANKDQVVHWDYLDRLTDRQTDRQIDRYIDR